MLGEVVTSVMTYGRAPYGARGLKYFYGKVDTPRTPSRPVWGAWIEIRAWEMVLYPDAGRAPYGARGLKCDHKNPNKGLYGVAPRMGRVD